MNKEIIKQTILAVLLSIAFVSVFTNFNFLSLFPLYFTKISAEADSSNSADISFYDEYISGRLLPSVDFDRLERLVSKNPDNPRYQFGLGYLHFMFDKNDPLPYFHKAAQLDSTRAMYHYYLGLAHSGRRYYESDVAHKDSAFISLERARKFDSTNVAIDIAQAELFWGSKEFIEEDSLHRSIFYFEEEGKKILVSALAKQAYRSYRSIAAGDVLTLLRDSGQKSAGAGLDVLKEFSYTPHVEGSFSLKYFSNNLGPFSNEEEMEAMLDTLIQLANIGNMMREDMGASFMQFTKGSRLIEDMLEKVGDVYLAHDKQASEKLVSLFRKEVKFAKREFYSNRKFYLWFDAEEIFIIVLITILEHIAVNALIFMILAIIWAMIIGMPDSARLPSKKLQNLYSFLCIFLSIVFFFLVKTNIAITSLITPVLIALFNAPYLKKTKYGLKTFAYSIARTSATIAIISVVTLMLIWTSLGHKITRISEIKGFNWGIERHGISINWWNKIH